MRSLNRACRDLADDGLWWPVVPVSILLVMFLAAELAGRSGAQASYAGRFFAQYVMLALLGVAVITWTVLRIRTSFRAPGATLGLLVAALGLASFWRCDFFLYRLPDGAVYGGTSALEDWVDELTRKVWLNRVGGIAAYVLGMAAFGWRCFSAGRGATSRGVPARGASPVGRGGARGPRASRSG